MSPPRALHRVVAATDPPTDAPTDDGDALTLHLWRRLDWRFLLADPQVRRVGYGGDVDAPLEEALRLLDPRAVRLGSGAVPDAHCDVIVLSRPGPQDLRRAWAALRPGGWVCVESLRSGSRHVPRSLAGWSRVLRRLGFDAVRTYWSAPNLAQSSRVVPVDGRTAVANTLTRHGGVRFGWIKSVVGRLALQVGLFRLVAPEGLVLARRPGDRSDSGTPFVDRVLQENEEALGLPGRGVGAEWETVLLTPRFVTSRHLVALIFPAGAREPGLVVKVPRQPGDNDGVRREAATLAQLRNPSGRPVPGTPELVGVVQAGSHTVLVETAVAGAALDPDRVSADLPAAVGAGLEFLRQMPITRAAADNPDWYDRLVTEPLRQLERLARLQGQTADLCRRTHTVLDPLRSRRLPAIFEHGDLSHPNLLVGPDGRLRVLDWERSTADGLPAHDLIFYLQYLAESAAGAYHREEQLLAHDEVLGPRGWGRNTVRDHLQEHGVDPGLLPLLVVTTWARSAATLAYRLPPGSGQVQVDAAVADDRDFWLWRHAVRLAEASGSGAQEI
ncbi:MAG TPA: aminoglycoside phosphotransferase family protein [Microlunatus sp.]